MAWTTNRTFAVGDLVTPAMLNSERDNKTAISTHDHGGAAGDGASSLGDLVKTTFADATAPAAPGASKTVIYATGGRPGYRPGASGAATELADENDLHAQDHASRHEPGGADAMAVDAAAATGSLRTLGTGAQQIAAGNHTH